MTSSRSARAFTLVEATLSVVIVGGLLVASTATFGSLARARRSQSESRLAYLLGQQLMAEIVQSNFQQPGTTPVFGPTAGLTRPDFTYVDAYDGYVASPPVSAGGAVLSDYPNWSERVRVTYVDPANPASATANSTLKRIAVTITAPSGKSYSLTGFRSKFGAYEVAPTSQMTYVTGVAVSLKGAKPAKTVYAGAHPLNVTSSQ